MKKIDLRFLVLLIFSMTLGFWRFFSIQQGIHVWNFTPVGALALFGGTYFSDRYKAYFFPLLILFFSDLLIMQSVYKQYSSGLLYSFWGWTYGSFLLMTLVARLAAHPVTVGSFISISVLSALVHYLVSDFGVWLAGGVDLTTGKPYTRDWQGLLHCYALALPFLRNILMGNLIYGAVFFGAFEWLQRRIPALRATPVA